jgi:hypothetical protein
MKIIISVVNKYFRFVHKNFPVALAFVAAIFRTVWAIRDN